MNESEEKTLEQSKEITKKESENKWYYVVKGLREEKVALEKIIEDKNEIIASQEEEISGWEKKHKKLEDKFKASEADFVYISKMKKGEYIEKNQRGHFMDNILKKKGYHNLVPETKE